MSNLQILDLHNCESLIAVPESVGQLTALQKLRLDYCPRLRTLPESLGRLMGLQHLLLRGCSGLETLPESVGDLTGLQELDLVATPSLDRSQLPSSILALTVIKRLNLGRNSSALQRR